jgi:hypothetical protein
MDHSDVPDLARILLENTPRDAAKETLWRLMARLRARSVALWRETPNGDLALEMGLGVDGETITKANSLYAARQPESVATLSGENALLARVARPETWWVYADGVDPRSVDVRTIVDFACFAAAALHRSFTVDDDERGSPVTIRAIKREQLVATLRLHEWNIARTARAMSVTRKTIYDWLGKYKISREWVPK